MVNEDGEGQQPARLDLWTDSTSERVLYDRRQPVWRLDICEGTGARRRYRDASWSCRFSANVPAGDRGVRGFGEVTQFSRGLVEFNFADFPPQVVRYRAAVY